MVNFGDIVKVVIFALEIIYLIKMIFKRKLYDEMLKWKQDSKGSTALLIKGQDELANPHSPRRLRSKSTNHTSLLILHPVGWKFVNCLTMFQILIIFLCVCRCSSALSYMKGIL